MLQCSIISYSVCRVTWRDPDKKEQAMPAKNISPQPSGGSPTRELDRSRKASRAKPQRVSLALQGGGAYGAFTWGVLDRLLEEEISFDAVSGASIGAINAALLASGLAKDGPDGARETLDAFWTKLSRMGILNRLLPPELLQAASALGVGSPYQFNPLDLNPVRDLLAHEIDFDSIQTGAPVRLLLSATRVSDGALRIFREQDVTLDVVLASSCVPQLHHAVSINGEPHWDGGFAANPPLIELIGASKVSDVLLVQIIPMNGADLPRTKKEIEHRLNQITFNSPLKGELEAISTMKKLSRADGDASPSGLSRKVQRLRLHQLAAEDHVPGLAEASILNVDASFLSELRDAGRRAGDIWLSDQRSLTEETL